MATFTNTKLTEQDIPGASLGGKYPANLKIDELLAQMSRRPIERAEN